MIELRQTWTAVWRWRMIPALVFGVWLLQGCGADPSGVGAGPLFQAQEYAPPGKALVYVYWPPGEKGALEQICLAPSGGPAHFLRGGYSQMVLEPGTLHFSAWMHWIVSSRADVAMDLGELEMAAEAGKTYFVRVEEKPRFLIPHIELQPVEAAAALSEIRKCRQMVEIPLQMDAEGNVVSES